MRCTTRLSLLLALACGSAGILVACGDSGHNVAVNRASTAGSSSGKIATTDDDYDYDSRLRTGYDSDDGEIIYFGKRGLPVEERQIASLVESYYRAGVAKDGTRGCMLTDRLFAEELVESFEEQRGGHASDRLKCSIVMSKLFARERGHMVAVLKGLHLYEARVSPGRGYALLGKGHVERYLLLHRESGVWRMQALIDSTLP